MAESDSTNLTEPQSTKEIAPPTRKRGIVLRSCAAGEKASAHKNSTKPAANIFTAGLLKSNLFISFSFIHVISRTFLFTEIRYHKNDFLSMKTALLLTQAVICCKICYKTTHRRKHYAEIS
jgi:hypothetical protein